MAVEGLFELDFHLKSKGDLEVVLEKLKDFFTYDYIGENRYTIDKLNLKMDVSYYRNEEERYFEHYFANAFWRKSRNASELLCKNLIGYIKNHKDMSQSFSESDFSDIVLMSLTKEINSFNKYVEMMSILNTLDTFSIKFWEYCIDKDGEIIEGKRDYLNIITEKNYK